MPSTKLIKSGQRVAVDHLSASFILISDLQSVSAIKNMDLWRIVVPLTLIRLPTGYSDFFMLAA
jgi:hypothetical protein